jgi:hypothetical protein
MRRRSLPAFFGRVTASACLAGILLLAAPASAEEGPAKVAVVDPVLDRNGDGFQDVIVKRKAVHYDIDYDGHFDFTLRLPLSYKTDWHKNYIASNGNPEVFAEITMESLDELCATDRDKAGWYENNFRDFPYYSGGYKRLSLFSASPLNDGRLAGKKHKGEYEYHVAFNPDGTVHTVKQADRKVALAKFDEGSGTSSGEKMTLPVIENRENLDQVGAKLAELFK